MNAFDDNLKNRAGEFQLEPRKEVWERVVMELDSKKRKRRLVWFWWFAPLLLAGGATTIYFTNQNTPKTIEQKVVMSTAPPIGLKDNKTPANTTPPTTAATDRLPMQATLQPPLKEEATLGNQIFVSDQNEKSHHQSIPNGLNNYKKADSNSNLPPDKTIETVKSEVVNVTEAEVASKIVVTEKELEKNQAVAEKITSDQKEEFIVAKDTAVQIEPLQMAADSQKTNLEPQPKPTVKKGVSKSKWNVLVGTGLHNHSGKALGFQDKAADYSYLPNTGSGSGPGNSFAELEPSKPGLGFMLGFERSQPFGKSKHWSWLAGLHYQYQSVHYQTGPLKDSALIVGRVGVNNNTSGGTTADYFYKAGNTIEQKGSQHRTHLLAAIQWHMGAKQKWTWQNGFYGGLVLANDYLLPQNTLTGWLPSKGLTQKGYVGMETGIKFQPLNWGAGIFGQYNLTSSVKVSGMPSQYWRGIELRFNYNISSSFYKK